MPLALWIAGATAPAFAAVASDWAEGFNSRTRLLAGTVEESGASKVYAFVEITMPKGWKTYWRNPGDAGGIPPAFVWSRSGNLARADVLYPVPQRMTDPAGDNIGYYERVMFPVAIEAKDASKPVSLGLDVSFGICKDICVPAEAALDLEIPPGGGAGGFEADALGFLAGVPKAANGPSTTDPALVKARLETAGPKPKLVVEARFPAGTKAPEAFLEAPDGLYVPMFQRTTEAGADVQVFETDLGSLLEPKDLKGKSFTLTLAGDKGGSVSAFTLD